MAMQENELGLRLRRALTARTGVPTIPQLFVGGAFVGGAVDAFEAYSTGALQARLSAIGVPFKVKAEVSPSELLPKWLHPRAEAAPAG